MAELTLTQLYVHDYTDPTDYDTFEYATLSEQWRRVGRVRRLAGGRLRLVTEEGAEASYTVTFVNLTTAEVQSLRDRCGAHVVVRDQRGRLIYGVYFEVEVEDRPENELRNAAVNLATVSGTVEV